jgi:uncharacterized protein (TIGR00375 family)
MRFIADLHIHSRYSRACSRDLTPESLWRWGQLKGIRVIGTGDCTHPLWLSELREKLEPSGNNLLTLKKELQTDTVPESCRAPVSFLLTGEISCIYSKGGKTRKVHALVFLPDFAAVERLNTTLGRIGNLNADGRPILGLDVKRLLQMVLDSSPDAMLVPAHAWTPHFSLFGASSGFDSLEECFEELTPQIHAIETGLSSDPPMNWRLSQLDKVTLISNSDAHSPAKLGREANIFATGIGYGAILQAIKDKRGFLGTIEFFPEEGKYYSDGHRECGVRLTPQETMDHDYLCPACRKKVTVGVLHRVEKLADLPAGRRPEHAPFFHSIIPLAEIIAEVFRVGVASKKVARAYFDLLEKLGSEFTILIETAVAEIARAGYPLVGEAIRRMRAGEIRISPGFDGAFGKIILSSEE